MAALKSCRARGDGDVGRVVIVATAFRSAAAAAAGSIVIGVMSLLSASLHFLYFASVVAPGGADGRTGDMLSGMTR